MSHHPLTPSRPLAGSALRATVAALALALSGCGSSGAQDADASGSEPGDAEPIADQVVAPSDAAHGPEVASGGDVADAADITPPPDGEPACACEASMWCGASGCVPDVCAEGETNCQDLTTVLACAEDGSSFELIACPEGDVCHGGQCLAPICDPDAPPVCDGPTRMTCNSLGLELVPLPCSAGTGCIDGTCQPIEPNVLLIVDTSTSMSLLADAPDTYPSDCVGPGCPVWEYPTCDDPADPMTRIARVKVAIDDFLQTDAAQQTRLALMRFPQTGLDYPDCQRGNYGHLFFMWGDDDKPETDFDWFTTQLFQTLCTGFSETAASNLDDMARWLDFEEVFVPNGQACDAFWDCQWETCNEGQCHSHTNPELRGTGPTPLGKSLFYAGEYLRHLVLNEGKPCSANADCRSPHYSCVDGACRDPFFACRQTSVIVFTDGFETVYESTEDFFNPLVQAKRLRYGLGCASEADCLSGAQCTGGVCRFEGEEQITEKQCNAYASSCATDADCPAFDCGLPEPCDGVCQTVTVKLTEPNGVNTLTTVEGTSLPITIHVIDASGTVGSNQLIAAYGGGTYAPVDLADLSALTDILKGLAETKPDATPCD
jgi:hypothetical protein